MYYQNIKHLAKENQSFRHVLYTTPRSQVVVMSLLPGEDIGEEVHEGHDQLFFIIDGQAEATVNGQPILLDDHYILVVPAGSKHNIRNSGEEELKLCTIYTPPTHKDGTIHQSKADAVADEADVLTQEEQVDYASALEDPYA